MFPYPYYILKTLVDERYRDLSAQARLARQLVELDRNKAKQGMNWSIESTIRGLLEFFIQPELVTQPEVRPPNCQIEPDCHIC